MIRDRRFLVVTTLASLALLVVASLGVALAQQTTQQAKKCTAAQCKADPGPACQCDPAGGPMMGRGRMGYGMMGRGMMGRGMMGRGMMGRGMMGRGMMGPAMMGRGAVAPGMIMAMGTHMLMTAIPAVTAWGGKVYVVQDGCLFEFDAKTLKLEKRTRFLGAAMMGTARQQRGRRAMKPAKRTRWQAGKKGKSESKSDHGKIGNW